METPFTTDTLEDATTVALLEEQERITTSKIWEQHEAFHESRGETATFTPSVSHDDEQPPTLQEPLYKEGTFPVGGCTCGFNIQRNGQGMLIGEEAKIKQTSSTYLQQSETAYDTTTVTFYN